MGRCSSSKYQKRRATTFYPTGINNYINKYKDVEGEKQQVCFFFNKLSKQELTLLALRFAWKQYENNPDDEYFTLITKDLVKKLLESKKLAYIDYCDYGMGSAIDTVAEKETDSDAQSKYERIKKQQIQGSDKVKPRKDFSTTNYMLVDLRQNPAFFKFINSTQAEMEDEKILEDYNNKNITEKLLIWNPFYYKFKLGDKPGKYKNHQLQKTILSATKGQKLDVNMIDLSQYLLSSVDHYNNFCKLQNWFYDYVFSDGSKMIYYQTEGIDKVCKDLGVNYINIISSYSYPYSFSIRYKILPILASVLIPAAIPFTISDIVSYQHNAVVDFSIINLHNSTLFYSARDKVYSTCPQAAVQNFVYDNFKKISKKGGNK